MSVLPSLFRARRASTSHTRRRRFTPVLVDLESRQLMDGSPPNLVGGPFSFVARVTPPTPDSQIFQVNWNISNVSSTGVKTPGAMRIALDPSTATFLHPEGTQPYASALDQTGFHLETYDTARTYGDPATGGLTSTLTGHWDGTPGTHVVTIDVTWRDSSGKYLYSTDTETVNVQSPHIDLANQSYDPRVWLQRTPDGAHWYLGAHTQITATPDPTAQTLGGSFGFLQTVTSLGTSPPTGSYDFTRKNGETVRVHATGMNFFDDSGIRLRPNSVLDNSIENSLLGRPTIYYPPDGFDAYKTNHPGRVADGTQEISDGPITMKDTPNSELQAPSSAYRNFTYARNDSFLVSLIYTAPGDSLPVVLLRTTWQWRGTASYDATSGNWSLLPGFQKPTFGPEVHTMPGSALPFPRWQVQGKDADNKPVVDSVTPVTGQTSDVDPALIAELNADLPPLPVNPSPWSSDNPDLETVFLGGHSDPLTGDWISDTTEVLPTLVATQPPVGGNPFNVYHSPQSDRYTYGPNPKDPTSAPYTPTAGTTMITAAEAGKRGIAWWNMPLVTVQAWNADWDDWQDLEWYVEVPS